MKSTNIELFLQSWFQELNFTYDTTKPITRRQILDSSKLKEFADDNFKFDKWIENTVGKGEIVCYEQFLLFP